MQLIHVQCSLTSLLQCQCQPNAELENSFSKVMLRCSLTSLLQRYNRHPPKSKFFRRLISHLKSFPHPKTFVYPFVYGHFGTFSTPRKKWNRDISILPVSLIQMYQSAVSTPLHQTATLSLRPFSPPSTHSNFQLPPWIVGKQQKKTYLCSKANTNRVAHHCHSQLSRQRVRAAPTTSKYPHPLWKQSNP